MRLWVEVLQLIYIIKKVTQTVKFWVKSYSPQLPQGVSRKQGFAHTKLIPVSAPGQHCFFTCDPPRNCSTLHYILWFCVILSPTLLLLWQNNNNNLIRKSIKYLTIESAKSQSTTKKTTSITYQPALSAANKLTYQPIYWTANQPTYILTYQPTD